MEKENYFSKHKTEILWAAIFAVVALILAPYVVNLFSRFFVFLSETVYSVFLDNLYKDISHGKTDYALAFQNMFLVSPIAFALGYLSYTIGHNIRMKQNNLSKETQDKQLIKQTKSIKRFGIAGFIFLVLAALIIVVGSNMKYATIMSFEQEIKILTPYIDSQEKDVLISRFSSMKSYKDYIGIDNDIKKLASQKNIALPEKAYLNTY